MANLNVRLNELIGSGYTDIASLSYLDLFNAAVNEVADMLPSEVLLKYADNPADLSNSPTTWTSVEGAKVLLVMRLDSAGVDRECRAISIQDFGRAKDSNSLYYATEYSPVYCLATDAGATALNIAPITTASETAKIYQYTYSRITDLAVETIANFPPELEQAVVLRACVNILQSYMSDFIQDEEDNELVQLILAQMDTLNKQFQQEMSRYTETDKQPRGE